MSEKEDRGRVYWVLGATGGIGAAVARRLARRGATLVLSARSEEPLAALCAELGAEAAPLDATRPEAVETAARETAERHGGIGAIVNCVGSLLLKPAHLTTDEEWGSVLAANLGSAFSVVRAAGRRLERGGSVVLVSSAAARVGLPNHEAIAAAKGGIEGLVRSAAATYAPKGIRFNAVAPGLVRTPMTARITSNPAAEKGSAALHPLGRIGEPDEVAETIVWLAGESSGWVTGQVIGVDGGLATVRAKAQG